MTEIIAECATGHGGDVGLAVEMVAAAAEAGAHTVKFQTYDLARLHPDDPQAAWLRQAHLDRAAHDRLRDECDQRGVEFLSTPFDGGSLALLRALGCRRFKIASSEAASPWWTPAPNERWLVSWPWGQKGAKHKAVTGEVTHLTAIPLYPTPLEAVSQARLLDGWSDHTVGLDACLYQLARGARVVEVHFTLPGRSRRLAFDKSPDDLRLLRGFAEAVATMQTGVSETFRKRWSA